MESSKDSYKKTPKDYWDWFEKERLNNDNYF
jgi:hypothetical protein